MVRQPFHLVEFSPWPLVGSLGAFSLVVGLASWFHHCSLVGLCVGLCLIFLTILH